MIFSKFENLLKTISDDSIQHPKGHPSIPGKKQNFQFFDFGNNIYIYIMAKIEKNKNFDFFPELMDDLWDVEYYHH